jgi:hypothetical protein
LAQWKKKNEEERKKERRDTSKGLILTGLLMEGLDRVPGSHLR